MESLSECTLVPIVFKLSGRREERVIWRGSLLSVGTMLHVGVFTGLILTRVRCDLTRRVC